MNQTTKLDNLMLAINSCIPSIEKDLSDIKIRRANITIPDGIFNENGK